MKVIMAGQGAFGIKPQEAVQDIKGHARVVHARPDTILKDQGQ